LLHCKYVNLYRQGILSQIFANQTTKKRLEFNYYWHILKYKIAAFWLISTHCIELHIERLHHCLCNYLDKRREVYLYALVQKGRRPDNFLLRRKFSKQKHYKF
jgi:hypothetical protein